VTNAFCERSHAAARCTLDTSQEPSEATDQDRDPADISLPSGVHPVGRRARDSRWRLPGPASPTSCSGYYTYTDLDGDLGLVRADAGSFALLGTSTPCTAGQTIRLYLVGNTIAVLCNLVVKISVTDATYATGLPGVAAFNDGGSRGDNWTYTLVAATKRGLMTRGVR
jgi:hypothetical protein